MNSKSIIFLILFSLFITIISSTAVSFESDGEGYTIEDNILTITGKEILVDASCTLNLNEFSLSNSGSLTPLLISSGKQVNLVLKDYTTFTDSPNNEHEGTIYLEDGATLTISGTRVLIINPKKLMGINGTTSTSLIVNDGPTIKIQSTSGNIGCIYLRKAITFNDVILTCSVKGEKHSIDSEGTIKLIRGTYYIGSSGGKGIKSENNLYIGEENGSDSLLDLTIDTNNIGIVAKQIKIYSGKILIFVDKDGIKAASSGKVCDKETVHCSGNCTCYINYKGGKMFLTSGEVGLDSNGDITITGG